MTALSDLLRYHPGVGVRFHCSACLHTAVKDALPLSVALGEAFPVSMIGGKGKCTRCGSKAVETQPDYLVARLDCGLGLVR